MKYTLSEQERKRRRAYTATLRKCKCGNVAGKDQVLCGSCRSIKERTDLEDRRNAWIDKQMAMEIDDV